MYFLYHTTNGLIGVRDLARAPECTRLYKLRRNKLLFAVSINTVLVWIIPKKIFFFKEA